MKFVIDGREYGVRFWFNRLEDVNNRPHVDTFCFISLVDNTKTGRERYKNLIQSKATNHSKHDMFVRITGKKLALARALKSARFRHYPIEEKTEDLRKLCNAVKNKHNRKIVWNAFNPNYGKD